MIVTLKKLMQEQSCNKVTLEGINPVEVNNKIFDYFYNYHNRSLKSFFGKNLWIFGLVGNLHFITLSLFEIFEFS